MVGESILIFLIQIDASNFAEFEISEFEISKFDCTYMYSRTAITRGRTGMTEKLELSKASDYAKYFCLKKK